MYTNGSAAIQIEQEAYEAPSHLRVVTSEPRTRSHARPQAQATLSPMAVTAIKCAVAFVAVALVAAFVRVAIMASAFGFAAQNAAIESQLSEARSQGAELEVQQSVYGSSDRIKAIATDVYGMVPADSVAVLDLSAVDPAASGETASE